MNNTVLNSEARRLARELGVDYFRSRRLILAALERVQRNATRSVVQPQTPTPTCHAGDPRTRPEGYVDVPFAGRSPKNAALRRCANHAATKSAASPFLTVTIMTHFLQAIADEVAFGSIVSIPGLGRFGPYCALHKDGHPRVYPRFVPARPFRLHVNGVCHPSNAKNEQMESYRRSHHPGSRPDRATSGTPAAMEAWRRHIHKQAGYIVSGEQE